MSACSSGSFLFGSLEQRQIAIKSNTLLERYFSAQEIEMNTSKNSGFMGFCLERTLTGTVIGLDILQKKKDPTNFLVTVSVFTVSNARSASLGRVFFIRCVRLYDEYTARSTSDASHVGETSACRGVIAAVERHSSIAFPTQCGRKLLIR